MGLVLAATAVILLGTPASAKPALMTGGSTVATLTPVLVVADRTEPHPEIRAAIHSLERARDHLQHAAHDFGGHRVEAIAAIDAALKQLHQALEFDK